tara:strand:- start:856 stop:1554 length:699 start_codon:yes stop_codon:yes gene_type:complete
MKKILHLLLITVLIYFLFFTNNKEGFVCGEIDNENNCEKNSNCYYYKSDSKSGNSFFTENKCLNRDEHIEKCKSLNNTKCLADEHCSSVATIHRDKYHCVPNDGNEPLVKYEKTNWTNLPHYRGMFHNTNNLKNKSTTTKLYVKNTDTENIEVNDKIANTHISKVNLDNIVINEKEEYSLVIKLRDWVSRTLRDKEKLKKPTLNYKENDLNIINYPSIYKKIYKLDKYKKLI